MIVLEVLGVILATLFLLAAIATAMFIWELHGIKLRASNLTKIVKSVLDETTTQQDTDNHKEADNEPVFLAFHWEPGKPDEDKKDQVS